MAPFKLLLLLAAALALCLAACSRKSIPLAMPPNEVEIRDTTVYIYTQRDSLVHVPGDTVHLSVPVPCPDSVATPAVSKRQGGVHVTAQLHAGRMEIDCRADSLKARIQWLEKQGSQVRTIRQVINVPVRVPEPYIPDWCYWVLAIATILVLNLLRPLLQR